MPPKVSVKARLARKFLSFLDEHGDYRAQLEEAAARAAAAEANSIFGRGRKKKKKKKKRRGKLGGLEEEDDDDEEWEEEEWEELPSPDDENEANNNSNNNNKNVLPEDPYEQIQFYFRTFKHRTRLQAEEAIEQYRSLAKSKLHDELHHPARVPLLSGGMLASILLAWAWRSRGKKIGTLARWHGILGKKMDLREYLHSNLIKGRVLLRYSVKGGEALGKLRDKARKAEEAALASMRPYQRKKYERYRRLERAWEWCVAGCLLLGVLASGATLVMCLDAPAREWYRILYARYAGNDVPAETLDGEIYAFDGPTDDDAYPLGAADAAEESYAACLADAELNGTVNPASACDLDSFFAAAGNDDDPSAPMSSSSPLRAQIREFLSSDLRIPPALASYLTALGTRAIAYLSSLLAFALFLLSQSVANRIHAAAVANDPMKHFVLAATDKSVKADGTVVAKRGETEAQRKRRERMLQNEKLKAQMAQLAMEAKQRVAERRARMDEKEGKNREEEERKKKEAKEQDEAVECHERQYGMLKMGVPEGAVLNTFAAEGIDEEEGKEIVAKLKAARARKAEEAEKAEEDAAKKLEEEKEAEAEKDRIAAERLRMMKKGGTAGLPRSDSSRLSLGTGGGGGNSVVSAASSKTSRTSVASRKTAPANPAAAKSAMLGQIAVGGGLKSKKPVAPANPAAAKSAMLGQIAGGGGLKSKKTAPVKVAAASDIPKSPVGKVVSATPGSRKVTPKKSNKTEGGKKDAVAGDGVPRIPSRLKITGVEEEEEKKGEEESNVTPPTKSPSTTSAEDRRPPRKNKTTASDRGEKNDGDRSHGPSTTSEDRRDALGLRRPSARDVRAAAVAAAAEDVPAAPAGGRFDALSFRRPSSRDIRATIAAVESAPEEVPQQPAAPPTRGGFDALSFRRPSARDIQATIAAVENAPEEEEEPNGTDDAEEGTDLAPGWLHSPAFETALRNSNASWDRRPSNRDINARIKAVEEFEERQGEQQQGEGLQRSSVSRSASFLKLQSLGIINEGRNNNANHDKSYEDRNRANRTGNYRSDDEISALSEPSFVTSESNTALLRSIPQNLELSPMVSSTVSALSPANFGRKVIPSSENMASKLANLAPPSTRRASEKSGGDSVGLPVTKLDAKLSKSEEPPIAKEPVAKEETAEERKRRERAEARAKKMEAIAARRNAGEDDSDDDEVKSAISGRSKRRRMRRTKKGTSSAVAAVAEEGAPAASEVAPPARAETAEEKKRRERAEARARKLEAMAARRNAGDDDDDGTTVTGISRRHRNRRRKSALVAAKPDPREAYRKGVYASVLGAERARWKRCVYGHVLDAEASRAENERGRRELEEQNDAARRRAENRGRLEQKARKFAARAERFHKMRREGNDVDDDESVAGSLVSSASKHRRRRRGRKSTASSSKSKHAPKKAVLPLAEESAAAPAEASLSAAAAPAELTAEAKEKRERDDWCRSAFATVLHAEQSQWKNNVYGDVLGAEGSRNKRRETDAKIARDLAAAEARREKEHQNKLRAEKMEKMKQIRDSGARGENSLDAAASEHPSSVPSAASSNSSSLKKMRDRRRKAARKSLAK